ncbi:MogA/MoaB family molybdenum cofactor biosynthesis protein [Bariatricus sp. SGI.154]|uniref:MogA/MoaB family molybdenum cofactor biosynthesis protein n=1 Tax=Bariatricus sp. SGI.154 TaxID=3420549 RepID=UPI003D040405
MRVAIITANTDIYRGNEENASGEVIQKIVEEAGLEIVFMRALPLDREVLSTVMERLADNHLTDLVLTTGGAGCGPQDCTPEATMDVVERPVLGIPEAMRAHTMQLTKRSMLNRSAAGIRKDVLIVNLPGKAQAVKESLRYLLPEIMHAVKVIQGEA